MNGHIVELSEPLERTLTEWASTLETATEHACHAIGDLHRKGLIHEESPPSYPPRVADEVGTVAYHLAAMARYMQRVYEGIRNWLPEYDAALQGKEASDDS